MMAGQFPLVLTGACQFGHGAGGFTTNCIHSEEARQWGRELCLSLPYSVQWWLSLNSSTF